MGRSRENLCISFVLTALALLALGVAGLALKRKIA
jgi:hypothetical protein